MPTIRNAASVRRVGLGNVIYVTCPQYHYRMGSEQIRCDVTTGKWLPRVPKCIACKSDVFLFWINKILCYHRTKKYIFRRDGHIFVWYSHVRSETCKLLCKRNKSTLMNVCCDPGLTKIDWEKYRRIVNDWHFLEWYCNWCFRCLNKF